MKFKATLAGLLLAGFALSAGDASAQPHRAGPSYLYPDPATTPGVVNPDITQGNIGETICNPNWSTKSIRPPVSYTNHLKVQQLAASNRLRKKGMTTALLFSTRCARGPLSEWKDAQEPSRAADCGPRRDRPRRAETVPGRSRALGREGSNPDQVVRGEGKCKHPVHAAGAPVPRLAHQPDGFEPAEDLLHSLAPLLADRVARMPSGSIVNRAAAAMAGVLGDMWGHSEQAHRRDEIARGIALVGPEGEAPVAIQRPEQFERGGPFGVAAGGEHAAADGQAVAVFHQHVAGVEELGFLPFAFAPEPGGGSRC